MTRFVLSRNSSRSGLRALKCTAAAGALLVAGALIAPPQASAQQATDAAKPAPAKAAEVEQIPSFDNDPLEPLNRTIYGVNYVVDHVFLRPIAYAYRDGAPEFVQDGVSNVLRNLKSPVVLANDSMQGQWNRAGNTAMRFLINSTVGVLGLFDVATGWGYPYHSEDFGQTLAVAGIGEGPYLVLPLIGPSNARDAVGTAFDWFIDPMRMYDATQNPNWAPEADYTRMGLTVLDTRTKFLDPVDELEKQSLDTYVSMRSAYGQMRDQQIRNSEGTVSAVSGDEFDQPAK